jgi:hypothetical protein
MSETSSSIDNDQFMLLQWMLPHKLCAVAVLQCTTDESRTDTVRYYHTFMTSRQHVC